MLLQPRLEFASRAALAVVAWAGVILQLVLSISLAQSNGKSVGAGVIAYFGYFTILTNIFVALVASALLFAKKRSILQFFAQPSLTGCATTAILLVGLAYHFLLRALWAPQGWQWVADNVLHYVVPLLALVHWLVRRSHEAGAAWAPLAWCIYPFGYLVYALARGEILSTYPYHFIDVLTLGYARVLVNAVGLLLVFIALGYIVWFIARARGRLHERAVN